MFNKKQLTCRSTNQPDGRYSNMSLAAMALNYSLTVFQEPRGLMRILQLVCCHPKPHSKPLN